MKRGDAGAALKTTTLLQTPSRTPEDRRSAAAAFELWQREWPTLFRAAAALRLESLRKTVAVAQGARTTSS